MIERGIEEVVVPTRVEAASEADRFGHCHPTVQRMPLGQIGDARPRFRVKLANVFAQDRGVAGIGLNEAEEHLDERRLACPVAAQKAVDAASRDAEIDDVDDAARAVVLGHAVDGDGVGHEG